MTRRFSALLVLFSSSLCLAQLTQDQKIADLRQLSSLYAKSYGPYAWKKSALSYDLLQLKAWEDRALATQDDIEFIDLLSEYVSSLNDAHDVVSFPFNFNANLGFTVDIYDWKVLVDSISRSTLPLATYPFQIGDELVSLDGTKVEDWLMKLARYSIAANPRSTLRSAASRIVSRSQSRIPWAYQLGDTAEVVIRRANGDLETYTIPWVKTGYAVTSLGSIPTPNEDAPAAHLAASRHSSEDLDQLDPWQRALLPLQQASIPVDTDSVLGSGQRSPLFALPGFTTRLGRFSTDFFYSGTYSYGDLRIGYVRIPTMNPSSNGLSATTAALAQLDEELNFLETNTDGLVIDVMRNPGGSVLYVEQLAQRFIPYEFRSLGFEYRPIAADVSSFGRALRDARNFYASDSPVLAGYESNFSEILKAFSSPGALTAPISLTSYTLQLQPARNAYTHPLIVLTDEFSASGGDAFPAILQDNSRGPLVGFRTMGAGGNVVDYLGANYSEASTRVTRSLMSRKRNTVTTDYPEAPYVENIGVRPDVEIDFMTRDNLMTSGRPFFDAMTQAIAAEIIKVRGY